MKRDERREVLLAVFQTSWAMKKTIGENIGTYTTRYDLIDWNYDDATQGKLSTNQYNEMGFIGHFACFFVGRIHKKSWDTVTSLWWRKQSIEVSISSHTKYVHSKHFKTNSHTYSKFFIENDFVWHTLSYFNLHIYIYIYVYINTYVWITIHIKDTIHTKHPLSSRLQCVLFPLFLPYVKFHGSNFG